MYVRLCMYVLHVPDYLYPQFIILAHAQVASYDLFRDESIHCELHLIVCQSIDQQHVIILGCRYMYVRKLMSVHMCMHPTHDPCVVFFLCRGCRDKDDEQRACYVSILQCPPHPPGTMPTPDPSLSIHFKFDILSPFPSFVPPLSLKIPGSYMYPLSISMIFVTAFYTLNPCVHV